MFFWIRVEKSMLSVYLVLEIYGLKVVVSFNFAPSAPHVKRRVKSCEPRAAAATIYTYSLTCIDVMHMYTHIFKYMWFYQFYSESDTICTTNAYFKTVFNISEY